MNTMIESLDKTALWHNYSLLVLELHFNHLYGTNRAKSVGFRLSPSLHLSPSVANLRLLGGRSSLWISRGDTEIRSECGLDA